MVIRVLAVPDYFDLSSFDEVFRTFLGWDGLGFSFHIHGQEFTSFLRRTRAQRKTLRDFQLRAREIFLYTCGGMDLCEWEFRVLNSEAGSNGDETAVCLAGRGASPPGKSGASKRLESVKHLLWHGNVEEAVERLSHLLIDLELTGIPSAPAAQLAAGVAEFETYIRNHQESIPNYGERYRQGDTISTAFVESTINQVVSRRCVKRQQMHWTLRGAHLLLQTRSKVLNNELEEIFQRYPLFRVQAKAA
jgi:hypothetical protein